jgi:DNA-binding response OmpR family regulator
LVKSYLEREGYQVFEADDGSAALSMARREQPDLIVLDLMIPEVEGIEVCRVLRGESDVFILMLTARVEEADKLVGLGVGADDYLTKPFSPRELVARVKAILRRDGTAAAAGTTSRAGEVEVDSDRHEAMVGGRALDLTSKEFEILAELAANPGIVYSREKILENVWGYEYFGDARVVDVHVAKLRKKLEDDPAHPQHLVTVRGVGYKLEAGKGK